MTNPANDNQPDLPANDTARKLPEASSTRPTPPKKRGGLSCSIPTLIATVLVFAALMLGYNFFFGEKPAPDYPGATKAELTQAGNSFVDSLYKDNKRENSVVKVFLTQDNPQQVLEYYTEELVNKAGYKQGERAVRQSPGTISISFNKSERIYALITSDNNDGRVKNQQPGQTYIILAQGRG